jgi:hypothetical protein
MAEDFKEIVGENNWQEFEKFIAEADEKIEQDMEKSLRKREEYRKYLIDDLKLRERVSTVNEEQLQEAEKELFSGNVVAADGTLCTFPLLTGVRCRIGVVATSYKNETIEKVLYISEREYAEKKASSTKEFFELLEKGSGVSNLFLQGVMSFKEREVALNRKEEWKFIHGQLVPMEIRIPRLGHGAFEVCLELAKKIVNNKKCVGVISGSTKFRFLNAGIILEPGEYMFANYLSDEVREEVAETVGNVSEKKTLAKLSDRYLGKIKIGIFRVGPKPYIFEAHEDYFDKAAALIIRDSLNQSFRGFPLLVDYADCVCKRMLGSEDFNQLVEHKLANKGGYYGYGFDMPERMLRRRG